MKRKDIGTFEVADDVIVVSDPCYAPDAWCAVVLHDAARGQWRAGIELVNEAETLGWGERIATLVAEHPDREHYNAPYTITRYNIGVDSGQCGIYDANHFANDSDAHGYVYRNEQIAPETPWYSMCCDVTDSKEQSGVITGGCVCHSGFGDGSYTLEIARYNGYVVGIRVIFIEDEDPDEE